jgi:hypothetical protein
MRERLAGMSRIDRRFIYLILAVAVTVPFIFPVSFEVQPSVETRRFARALDEAIREPGPIVVELAYGNQTVSELEPIALAVMRKLFHEKKQVIFLTVYETAAAFTRQYLAEMEKEYDLTYGEDYVFLGYAAAWTVAMYKLGTSFEEVYHEDDRGIPLKDLPIMNGIKSIRDTCGLVDIASNSNPRFWINFLVTPYNVRFLMAETAVTATDYFPFVQTGQVKGLIAGGRAGAELETLYLEEGVLKAPGDAIRSLGAQSLGLMVILGFIVLGNIGYFAGRSRRKAGAP